MPFICQQTKTWRKNIRGIHLRKCFDAITTDETSGLRKNAQRDQENSFLLFFTYFVGEYMRTLGVCIFHDTYDQLVQPTGIYFHLGICEMFYNLPPL